MKLYVGNSIPAYLFINGCFMNAFWVLAKVKSFTFSASFDGSKLVREKLFGFGWDIIVSELI